MAVVLVYNSSGLTLTCYLKVYIHILFDYQIYYQEFNVVSNLFNVSQIHLGTRVGLIYYGNAYQIENMFSSPIHKNQTFLVKSMLLLMGYNTTKPLEMIQDEVY